MRRETVICLAFVALIVLACCIPMCCGKANAREISSKEIEQLKKKIHRKFDRDEPFAYFLVKEVLHKVNPSHVNQLVRNWEAIPTEDRDKIVFMFEDAGLGKFLFLCLWESAADPNLVSSSGAIGLFQIMPRTAKRHCGISQDMAQLELYDPVVNAACAVEILLEKGALKNRIWGLIKYHGVLKSCKAKGYVQCTYLKSITETDERKQRQLEGAWKYVANALLHQEIGEQVIYKPKRRKR